MSIIRTSVRNYIKNHDPNKVNELYFLDTNPTIIQIRNNTTSDIYVSQSMAVSTQQFEVQVVQGGTRVIAYPLGINHLFWIGTGTGKIAINSQEGDVNAQDLDQTQQVNINTFMGDNQVEITHPLPIGDNNIGKVTIDNTTPVPVQLEGSSNVNIDNFPATQNVNIATALPVGNNHIGSVLVENNAEMYQNLDSNVLPLTGTASGIITIPKDTISFSISKLENDNNPFTIQIGSSIITFTDQQIFSLDNLNLQNDLPLTINSNTACTIQAIFQKKVVA